MRIVLSLVLGGARRIRDPPTCTCGGTRSHPSKGSHSSNFNVDCTSGPKVPFALLFRSLVFSQAHRQCKRPCHAPPILWVALVEQRRMEPSSQSPVLHPLPSPTRLVHESQGEYSPKGMDPSASILVVLGHFGSIRQVCPVQKGIEREGLIGTNRNEPNDA